MARLVVVLLPCPLACEWGRLAAPVSTRGGQPRKRTMDLAIAATANVHKVPLVGENIGDFQIISDLVDARGPTQRNAEPAQAPPAADSQ